MLANNFQTATVKAASMVWPRVYGEKWPDGGCREVIIMVRRWKHFPILKLYLIVWPKKLFWELRSRVYHLWAYLYYMYSNSLANMVLHFIHSVSHICRQKKTAARTSLTHTMIFLFWNSNKLPHLILQIVLCCTV